MDYNGYYHFTACQRRRFLAKNSCFRTGAIVRLYLVKYQNYFQNTLGNNSSIFHNDIALGIVCKILIMGNY
jgi:hypothetical protein